MKNILKDEIAKKIILEDNGSPYGGIDHIGEDLAYFVSECEDGDTITLADLNKELEQCGIKPIGDMARAVSFIKEYIERLVLPNILFPLMEYYVDDTSLLDWFYDSFLDGNDGIENNQEFINVYICHEYR